MEIHTVKTDYDLSLLRQNSYIIEGDTSCVVIDCGAPLQSVREKCNKPIEAIFLTHAHFDHCNYIEEYDKLNVPIFCSPNSKEVLNDAMKNCTGLFQMDMKYDAKNLHYLNDKEEVVVLGKAMKCYYTPGHSVDCMCYLFDNQTLFGGDTIFSIAVGRIDLSTSDKQELIKSLEFLKTLKYVDLYSGHGRSSNFDEQKSNIDKWLKIIKQA